MPTPAMVDKALFIAAPEQLRENRTRARLGLRRPSHRQYRESAHLQIVDPHTSD
jgi:hypothetical protein